MTPLELEDGYTLARPILDLPLDALNSTGSIDVAVTIPQSASWQRLRREFGQPGYLIGIESARNLQECFEDYHLRIASSTPLDQIAQPLYGHSLACSGSPTRRFYGQPATTVDLKITKDAAGELPPLRLIVMTDQVNQDRLNSIGVDEDLRKISVWVAWVGAGLLGIASLLVLSENTRHNLN